MAVCTGCGKKLGFLEGADGFCSVCRFENFRSTAMVVPNGPITKKREEQQERERERQESEITMFLLTTESASDLKIVRRVEVVTAEVAYGMNIFKDLAASFRDLVGGRSEVVQKTMRDARRTALHELKREAYLVGANAVVGVDLDYTEIGGPAQGMVMLVASGTAVVIETNSPP